MFVIDVTPKYDFCVEEKHLYSRFSEFHCLLKFLQLKVSVFMIFLTKASCFRAIAVAGLWVRVD